MPKINSSVRAISYSVFSGAHKIGSIIFSKTEYKANTLIS